MISHAVFLFNAKERSDWSTSTDPFFSRSISVHDIIFRRNVRNKLVYSNFLYLQEFFGGKNLCVNHLSVFFSASQTCGELMAVQRNWDYSKFPDDTIFFAKWRWLWAPRVSVCINFDAHAILVGNTFERKLQTVYYWIWWVHSLHGISMGLPLVSSEFGIKLFLWSWVS